MGNVSQFSSPAYLFYQLPTVMLDSPLILTDRELLWTEKCYLREGTDTLPPLPAATTSSPLGFRSRCAQAKGVVPPQLAWPVIFTSQFSTSLRRAV